MNNINSSLPRVSVGAKLQTPTTVSKAESGPTTPTDTVTSAETEPIQTWSQVISRAKKETHAIEGAILGAVAGATALLIAGPLAGGAMQVATLVATRENKAFHPLEVKSTDNVMTRGLKHTVNGTATALAYGGSFLLGACSGWFVAGMNGAIQGFIAGSEVPKQQR